MRQGYPRDLWITGCLMPPIRVLGHLVVVCVVFMLKGLNKRNGPCLWGTVPFMPTTAQQKKFDAFLKHPLYDQALEVLKRAISEGGLEREQMGKSWGITVCPDNMTIVRVNCGNLSLLDVFHGLIDPEDEKTYIRMAVIDDELGILGPPRGLAMYEGFAAHVENSILLVGPWDKWSRKIFDNKKICKAFKAHALAAKRTLPNPNWHNPLIEALLS